MLINILKHLLSSDQAVHPQVVNRTITFPPLPEGHLPSKQRKILIYYEYPTSTPTIVSALHVNGIHPYVLNGGVPPKKRDEEVQSFISGTDVNRRVLLFSSVGAAGLNLACADVVILYVCFYSMESWMFTHTLYRIQSGVTKQLPRSLEGHTEWAKQRRYTYTRFWLWAQQT